MAKLGIDVYISLNVNDEGHVISLGIDVYISLNVNDEGHVISMQDNPDERCRS